MRFKVSFKNYKRIISWLLVLTILFTGINWPTLSSFADATNELGVTKFEADYNYPYMMMVLQKDGENSDIYAVKSNTRLFYMSDYKIVVSQDNLNSSVDTAYYKWDKDSGVWTDSDDFQTEYDDTLARYVLFMKEGLTGFGETQFGYITNSELVDSNFDITASKYSDGFYIIGYSSVNENKQLTNANFIEYSEDDSIVNANLSNYSKLMIANNLAKNKLYDVTYQSLKNSNVGTLDASKVNIGDVITFPAILQLDFNDSIIGEVPVTLTTEYKVNKIYMYQETVLDDSVSKEINEIDEEFFDTYAYFDGNDLKIGSVDDDGAWNDDSYIVEVQATLTFNGNSRVHSIYLLVNAKEDNKEELYYEYLNLISVESIGTDDSTHTFMSFINGITSDGYYLDELVDLTTGDRIATSEIKVLGKNSSVNELNKTSKDLNTFKIYNVFENNYLKIEDVFNDTNILDDISYEIISAKDVDDNVLEDIEGNLSDYIEIKFNKSEGHWELMLDADKITEYRRDNRVRTAFNEVTIQATVTLNTQVFNSTTGNFDNVEKTYIAEFNLILDVVQYMNNNFVMEGTVIPVAEIEFSSSLTDTFAPIVTELRFLSFENTYQTLVNYSDYQLLFYTTETPMLSDDHTLSFNSKVSMEIYKNTNGVWEFYNYVKDIKDASINLPEEAGYRSIDFVSYNLFNKTTNAKVLSKNNLDGNFNMQLRNSKLPYSYLNGGSDNIFNTADGYNYYYVFRKGQTTYFLYKSKNPITGAEGTLNIPTDMKCYALMQNTWIPCDEESKLENGFSLSFESDFKNYLIYSNDSKYGAPAITEAEIGSVDYYKYVPGFLAINNYDYIIVETADGLLAVQWTGAELTVNNGALYFKDINTALFDLKVATYDSFAWLDSITDMSSLTYSDSTTARYNRGLVGSIFYANTDIKDLTSGKIVFDDVYANSSLVKEELSESDFACTKPDLTNIDFEGIGLEEEMYTDNGETSRNVLLQQVGSDYYAYFIPSNKVIMYDNDINIINGSNEKDLYISIWEDEQVDILVTKFDTETNSWKYDRLESYTSTGEDNVMYLYCHYSFAWYGSEIECVNNHNYNLPSENLKFSGDAIVDTLHNYTTEVDGELVTYYYLNGATLVENDEEEFNQYLDNDKNYWILVVPSNTNIIEPAINNGYFTVGENKTFEFRIYAPLYSTGIEVVNGVADAGSIVSYNNGKSNLYSNGRAWYSENDLNDEGKPEVKTIYIVNGQLKIYGEDVIEYQQSAYTDDSYPLYVEYMGRIYEHIPSKYYISLPDTQEVWVNPDGVEVSLPTKKLFDNYCYQLKDELYSFGEEVINGSGIYYVLYDGQKVMRSEVIDADSSVLYVTSGINAYYAIVNESNTIFDADVTAIVNGTESIYLAGTTVPVGTVLLFKDGVLALPINQKSLTFYAEDNFGNKSEETKVANISNNMNNTIIYGDTTIDMVNQEIEEARLAALNDTEAPVILYAYIFRGELRLGILDKAPEGCKPVGLSKDNWSSYIKYTDFANPDDLVHDTITYIDDSGIYTEINPSEATYVGLKLGDLLEGSNWQWRSEIGDGLMISDNTSYYKLIKDSKGKIQTGVISMAARDANGNECEPIKNIEVSEDANNTILFGASNVPADIVKMLQDEKEGKLEEDDTVDASPVIESIYVLNGVLYVVAKDDKGITDYGFQWKYISTMTEAFTGKIVLYDSNGAILETIENGTIAEGATIQAKTTVYRNENYMPIKVPNAITVSVTDTVGNVTKRNVYPTNANQVIYGEVSQTIKDLIISNGGTTEPPAENSFPVITSVYTYQGYLYVEGYANDGLHTYSYGFRVDEDSVYPGSFAGYDALDKYISITAGRVISKDMKVYKDTNFQRINFPTLITLSIRDVHNDETSESFYIDKDNTLYYGEEPNLKDENGNDVGLDDGRGDEGGGDKPGGPGTGDTPGGDTPGDGDDDGDGDDGDKDVVKGNDDKNVSSETESTPGIIAPDEELKDVDWSLYDYVLQLLDEDTERIVYSIRKDKAESIEMPKLQDSTTYIYKQMAIDEVTEEVSKTVLGFYKTRDTVAPVITKVWFSNYRLYVSAYDEGGLAKEPYLFSIKGTPVSNTKYSAANNIRAVYNDVVEITVVDEAGNATSVTVTIDKKTQTTLYQCVNPSNPVFVRTGTSKSVSYWLAYLKTKYNVDISDLTVDEINCSNISFKNNDGTVEFDFSNDGVLTYYNKKTNMYYALTLRALNAGKTFRSIIVQKGSEIDFALAFERKLLDVFGTTDGITWATDASGVIKRDSSLVLANNTGVAKIVASKDGVTENFYIVVGDTISSVKSSIDFSKENFAYTYLVNNNLDLIKGLSMNEEEAQYLVLDSSSDGVARKDSKTISVNAVGRQKILLLDVVNDKILEYNFEAVYVIPFISTFTDIIGSDNRADIEYLCERGVISQYPDYKYKTENKMTTKEFLTMLNRVRLTYDSDFELKKEDKEINLDSRDFDYYSSLNILSNLTQDEVNEMLSEYSLNKAVTFEEVIALISSTLLYDEYHTMEGYECPPGLEDVSEAALHLLAIGIIDEDDARNGTREVTKAEIAYMLSQTIRFLEY